jgi:hypothetical protein
MSLSQLLQVFQNAFARWCDVRFPVLHLRWQNQSLFESSSARGMRVLSFGFCWFCLVLLLWQGGSALMDLQVPTAQWQKHQLQAIALAHQAAEQQAQRAASESSLHKFRRAAMDRQAAIDELSLAWPNSAVRLTLLSRLQNMAQLRGLQVLQLKTSQEPDQHGFEVSSLTFSVRGTEWATHAYWQALNQFFQNGLWTSWASRLQPDGQYTLDGKLSLLWDAQDAFTDTGVALQEAHVASLVAPLVAPQTASLSSHKHVLPEQRQSEMRVVGAAQAENFDKQTTAWTWVRWGTQIHLVQPGQFLGLEHSQAKFADQHGLWLSHGVAQPETQLRWEDVKP